MFKPYRNTKKDMTFERAERAAWARDKKTVDFFRAAQYALMEKGDEDASFYMEMIADHLNEGGTLDPKDVTRILGF